MSLRVDRFRGIQVGNASNTACSKSKNRCRSRRLAADGVDGESELANENVAEIGVFGGAYGFSSYQRRAAEILLSRVRDEAKEARE